MYCVYEKVKQLWKRKVWTKDGIGSGAGLDLQYDPSQDLRSIQFYILGFGNFFLPEKIEEYVHAPLVRVTINMPS